VSFILFMFSGVQDVIPAVPVGVEKSASHHLWLSQGEIGSDNPCSRQLSRNGNVVELCFDYVPVAHYACLSSTVAANRIVPTSPIIPATANGIWGRIFQSRPPIAEAGVIERLRIK
jgi:hypothetical protein